MPSQAQSVFQKAVIGFFLLYALVNAGVWGFGVYEGLFVGRHIHYIYGSAIATAVAIALLLFRAFNGKNGVIQWLLLLLSGVFFVLFCYFTFTLGTYTYYR